MLGHWVNGLQYKLECAYLPSLLSGKKNSDLGGPQMSPK